MPNFDLGDYVDVNERLAWFFTAYPEGSLQADILERGEGYVVIKAVAYRSPSDDRPGTGMASEPVPGRTPYTKDSEIMVGETSAWGRALAAIGAPTKGSIASREEVSNRTPAAGVAETAGPATTEAGRTLPPQAGGTSSDGGAGSPLHPSTDAGGSTSAPLSDAPGPPHYPLDPSACDHRNARSHRLLSPRKSPRGPVCPRCGLSYIAITESTNADLGAA